ncbi:MAG TPA: acyl-CoA reductase [Candidatus Acidoferrum sp.]|nr:acyl-CoA reductase [Candidatus Acidoferrum sp.]
MITVLLPANAADYESHLQGLLGSGTLPPFDPVLVDFVDAVSKAVLLDPVLRRMPEMAAVAHWMRKAHILDLRRSFEAQRGERIWLPRGTALHFAPSNVDSIFVYSWFISLLTGNQNVIRLSQSRGEQVEFLLATINRVCGQERFQPIRDRSLVLSYDHDDAVTQHLSETCQIRVLWGGDDSVRRLRAVPLNPLATEIAFANRFSLAVLNSVSVAAASDDALANLAMRFSNDSFWFDQMACSSPRLVVWIGALGDCKQAQNAFWPALTREVRKRGIEYAEVIGLNKMVSAYVSAAAEISDQILPGVTGVVSRLHVGKNAKGRFRSIECGGGLFFETELSHLDRLAPCLTAQDQTLSYFGFGPADLTQFALNLPARAVDRIVPIGAALEFNTVWDGYNLLQVFTREIDLR